MPVQISRKILKSRHRTVSIQNESSLSFNATTRLFLWQVFIFTYSGLVGISQLISFCVENVIGLASTIAVPKQDKWTVSVVRQIERGKSWKI